MKFSIVVTRRLPDAVERALTDQYTVALNPSDAPLTEKELADVFSRCDVLCSTITDRVGAALMTAPGRRVRLIANFGAGVEHIDLDAARRAGVMVTNTPDALTETTAELAILLMLMAARRASEGERELRAGRWLGWRPTHLLGQGLAGAKLGLVGFGRIAQAVGARAASLGMRVAYHTFRQAAVPYEFHPDLATLAAEADFLSLHVPGGPVTRHMINTEMLARMKPSAIIVNTSRGSVVDEVALAAALQSSRIAAAGLDVYEQEPKVHPALLACDTAVLLPHLGSATLEARTAMGMQMVRSIAAFAAGQDVTNRVA